uniref:ATP synthase subunit a n=1 Tax=Encyrtus infelix TaxID=355422 RepID=A0A411FRE5_9HYME|nr:ATP synthase F0 subunit 6 [Encyrtus infelix]QBA96083.1 ATP synthase F0 subunit 6 [Encyrtus infelix]QBA96096.1 ATP synthase F0 subunit 6 [Encyrtus infelix]
MVMNLFSSFDPSSSLFYSLNWVSGIYSMVILPMVYWFIPSRMNMMIFKFLSELSLNFKDSLGKNMNYKNLILYLSLLLLIFLNNLLGMFSYIFVATSHLVFGLSFAFVLWGSYMLNGWFNNSGHMFIHLVPQGLKNILMFFMVLVESLSNIIRPITLSVRLVANMVAGHLLMILISSSGSSVSWILLILMLLSQSILILLEISVSFIQAYVFSVLSLLYSVEDN